MIIHNVEQGTPEWFELRAGRVTGTRFKTIMMGKSTKGYQDLIAEMATELITGGADHEYNYTSPIMERGKDMEPLARSEFNDTVYHVESVGFITPDEGHEFEEWVGISPDGLLVDYAKGLEIKCPLAKTHLSYLEDGVLPKEYEHQVQGSLYVTGLDSWYFMSYYPKMKPFFIEVFPDKDLHLSYETSLRELIHQINKKVSTYKEYEF